MTSLPLSFLCTLTFLNTTVTFPTPRSNPPNVRLAEIARPGERRREARLHREGKRKRGEERKGKGLEGREEVGSDGGRKSVVLSFVFERDRRRIEWREGEVTRWEVKVLGGEGREEGADPVEAQSGEGGDAGEHRRRGRPARALKKKADGGEPSGGGRRRTKVPPQRESRTT